MIRCSYQKENWVCLIVALGYHKKTAWKTEKQIILFNFSKNECPQICKLTLAILKNKAKRPKKDFKKISAY